MQRALQYFRVPKKVFWSALALLVVLALGWALKPKKLDVDAGRIDKRDFESFVIDEGVSVYKNKHVITAFASGVVPTHTLKIGDRVRKNQVLMTYIWDRNLPVRSPIDGVIVNVFEKDRKQVQSGTPLLEIGDPEQIEIRTSLLSEEVIGLRVGQKASISKWGGDADLEARVQRIDPVAKEVVSALGVKEQRVDVYLDLITDRAVWSRLGDGFRLEVKIIRDTKAGALTVPIGALFRKGDKTALYVIDESFKARYKEVELAGRNRDYADLVTSFSFGTRVILYPGSQISDGTPVRIRREL